MGWLLGATLLPLLASINDQSKFEPAVAYAKAYRTFVSGHLDQAQYESDRAYQQSLVSAQQWSRRFLLLEATAMVWGGSDSDLLHLFSNSASASVTSTTQNTAEDIEQDALESTALTHLGRFSEASHKLKDAEGLCSSDALAECGTVLRARALFYLTRGRLEDARKTYLAALSIARQNQDKLLEGTLLLNLASAISAEEHHEEALDLYRSSYQIAKSIGANDLAQAAWSGQGWEAYNLGNPEKALEQLTSAAASAAALGDRDSAAQTLTLAALAQAGTGQLAFAEKSDLRAIHLAKQLNRRDKIINALEDLSQVYLDEGRPDEADEQSREAMTLAEQVESQPDVLYCKMLGGQAAAIRREWPRAEGLLKEVILATESQTRMRWNSEHILAQMYEAQGQPVSAAQSYTASIALIEGARGDLHQELSRLTFLNNAARIYDDYIHFLVSQGQTDKALEVADWSRARTLQQGLGTNAAETSAKPQSLHAAEIARATNTTLLFYWLGERQSYVWAVTSAKTILVQLPAKNELEIRLGRYRRAILALEDPLRANGGRGDTDGRDLYQLLVAPVAGLISRDRPVVLFTDGEMAQLNFETLLAANSTTHYWIEDVTLSSAPSIRFFSKTKTTVDLNKNNILVIGDAVSADSVFPKLAMAATEIIKVKDEFRPDNEVILSGARATPTSYFSSRPEQFTYIHFVAHATVSVSDPLESAVILSRDAEGDDSFKLYAKEIVKHPISARLVTISACNSSGATSYAGEGIVGLSWAFLRAGARNTIGSLWEVSDASTPDLMGHMYAALEQREPPAAALRTAKLALLHSVGSFSRPFYWAPFQLYSGR